MNKMTLDTKALAHIGPYRKVSKMDLESPRPCAATHTVSEQDLKIAGITGGRLTMYNHNQLIRNQKYKSRGDKK